MLFRNAVGTGKDDPPSGYDYWIDYWRAHTKSDPETTRSPPCAVLDCPEAAEVGAHIEECGGGEFRWIVPLCRKCNPRPECFRLKPAVQMVLVS